ncbi:MAG: MFS transporter [Eubacteriales bacterium]
MKKPLTKLIKTFYGIGDMGFTLMTNVESYLFIFFLTNIAKFSASTVIILGLICSIADAVMSPIYGGVVSGTKPMKWGRNRSWMLIMPPITVIFYTLMFTKIGSELSAAIIIIVGFVVSHFCMSIAYVGNFSLVRVLANNPEERALLASRRGAWTSAAGIAYSYLGTPLLGLIAVILGSEGASYTGLIFVLSTLFMILYYFVFAITKGYEPIEDVESSVDKTVKNKVTMGEMLKNLYQNPSLMVLIFGDFMRYIANFVLVASLVYYFTYIAQSMTLMPLYILFGGLIQVLGSFASGPLSKKFSNKGATVIAMFGVAGFELIARTLGYNVNAVFAMLLCYRFFHGIGISSFSTLYADSSIYGEWKTGVNAAPFVMGLTNVSIKVAVVLRSTIIPLVLAVVGFNASIAPEAASVAVKNGVLNMFLLIPGCCTLVCALLLLGFYKITNEKLEMYQKEIDGRKATA